MPKGSNPNSLEALKTGKRFSSTYQPNNLGKRKNKLWELVDKERVSLADLKTILESLIYNYSFSDLEAIHNPDEGKEELPIIIALFMKAFMTDHRKGAIDTLERLMDRVYGKPINTVDVLSDNGLSITIMTPEERRKRIEELLNKSEIKKPGRT